MPFPSNGPMRQRMVLFAYRTKQNMGLGMGLGFILGSQLKFLTHKFIVGHDEFKTKANAQQRNRNRKRKEKWTKPYEQINS